METLANQTKYECLLFDMDDTLYPLSTGINLACRKNIQEYMSNYLHIDECLIPKMCLDLYKEHGTTMAGLKALGYEIDNDEFHAYVHGRLPYEKLKPDPVLRNLLLSMPQRKIIFTNSDKAHAVEVLGRMGLEDCFEGVICFETLNPSPESGCDEKVDDESVCLGKTRIKHYHNGFFTDSEESDAETADGGQRKEARIVCKPALEAMELAVQIANVDPKKTIFFDDSARNIASGKAAGLRTVFVGSSVLVPGADFALESIHNIKEALPEIWEGEEVFEPAVVPANAIEALVLA